MLRIYLTEAFKNIKAKPWISLIIVLLFVFLIQILSYSLAWMSYHFWGMESYADTIKNEAFLEYSIYSLKIKSGMEFDRTELIKKPSHKADPEDPSKPIEIPLSEEDIAHNKKVVAAYEKLYEAVKNIDGLYRVDNYWTNCLNADGKAYPLSLQATQGIEGFVGVEFFTDIMDYPLEAVRKFCTYKVVKYNVDIINMQGFTCCEGRLWTDEDLDFEYMIGDDGTPPTIPIVMGYKFREYYDVGDVLSNPENPYNSQMFLEGRFKKGVVDQSFSNYVVIGFLEEETIVEYTPGQRMSLDSYLVVPFYPNTPENFPNSSIEGQANSFYTFFPQQLLYIEPSKELQVVEELTKVIAEDPFIGQYYYPEKNTQVHAVYEQIAEKRMINYFLVSASTLIFCVVIIILVIVNKIKNNIRDIAIHRLVGATVADSVKAYILEFAIYLLCADILSHYVYIIYAFDRTSRVLSGFWMRMRFFGVTVYMMYPLMIAMNIFFLVIVAVVAYICSVRLDTAEIIKGKE